MSCECLDETVLDYIEMAKQLGKDLTNPVVKKLLEAMAALDDERAKENPTEPERIKVWRGLHLKLETVTDYMAARLPEVTNGND